LAAGAKLTHNGNGSLIRIERDDGVIIENYFQPSGLRYARRVSSGGTTSDYRHFVYDAAGRLLEEYDRTTVTPQLLGRYYYASSDSPEAADLWDAASRRLIRYYFLKEADQSVIALVDSKGGVVERAWYDPFGQPVIEPKDSTPPVIRKIIGSDSGSLLVIMSEPVSVATNDPGPGIGLVSFPSALDGLVTLTTATGSIGGKIDLVPSVAGFPAYSAVRFSPTQTVAGAASLKIAAGRLADDWGNTNAAQTLNLQLTGAVGSVYYSVTPDTQTGGQPIARSVTGNAFLFHGQYFDYDSGLVYLRERFYDPFSGMFLEPDPLGYEGSVNLYAGMANNPVSTRDPSGLSGEEIISQAAEFVAHSEPVAEGAEELANGAKKAETIEEIIKNTKRIEKNEEIAKLADSKVPLSSSIIGGIKPDRNAVDMSLREAFKALAGSPEYLRALKRYNFLAFMPGVRKATLDTELIIQALDRATIFVRPERNLKAALWDLGEVKEGYFWMQADPSKIEILAFSTGKRISIHEMVHMAAALNGQSKAFARTREMWLIFRPAGKAWNFYVGNAHEIAVQLAATPETLLGFSGIATGSVGGVFIYLGVIPPPTQWFNHRPQAAGK
jgi:RHS repeat-associated protein